MNTPEQAGQSMDSSPAVMNPAAEGSLSKVLCFNLDMKPQLTATQDANSPNSTSDSELPRKGTDPADLAPEVPQSRVPCTTLDANGPIITIDEELPRKGTDPEGEESESDEYDDLTEELADEARLSNWVNQNTKNPNSTNDNAMPEKGTDPAGEKSESEQWFYPAPVTHVLVAGETFNTHETFIQKLKLQIERCSAEKCDIILVFCPVVSRIGTDMEAAMARVTEDKPVILVFMHHCHHPSHMTNITVQPSRSNIVQVVHCAFHETIGLLECRENEQVVDAVGTTLLRFCRFVDSQLDMEQQPMGTQNAKRPNITNDSELHGQSMESVGKESK